MSTQTLFPTIEARHWGAMFKHARTQGVIEGQMLLDQIRAAVKRVNQEKLAEISDPKLSTNPKQP